MLGGETVGVPLRRLRRGRRRGVRVLGHGERPASAEGSREDHHGEGRRERRRAGRPERVLEQPGAAGGEGVQRGRAQKQPGKHRKMAGKGKGKIGSTSGPIYERERERWSTRKGLRQWRGLLLRRRRVAPRIPLSFLLLRRPPPGSLPSRSWPSARRSSRRSSRIASPSSSAKPDAGRALKCPSFC